MVCTITNYAYANLTAEELSRAIEKAQRQELTQEEIEGIVIGLLRSIDKLLVDRAMDWEECIEKVEDIQNAELLLNQSACNACFYSIGMLLTGLILIEDGGPVAILGLFVLAYNMGALIHIIPYCDMCFNT